MQVANTAQLTAAGELSYILSPALGEEVTEAAAKCSVKHVPLGGHLMVWGCTRSGQARHISLRVDDYITHAAQSSSAASSTGTLHATNLSRLWATLKDNFIHPLLAVLCIEDNRPPLPSVQLLPMELKLLCLRHLPVRPALSRYASHMVLTPCSKMVISIPDLQARNLAALLCTCRDMRHVASSDELWDPLYAAEFGPLTPSERPALQRIGLMQAFGQAWAERSRRKRLRWRRVQPSLPHPGTGTHTIVPSPGPFPGIAGGDFDRLPHPFLGLPRGGGGGVYGGSGAAGLGFPLSFARGRRGAMQGALH